eukprot:g7637.t1
MASSRPRPGDIPGPSFRLQSTRCGRFSSSKRFRTTRNTQICTITVVEDYSNRSPPTISYSSLPTHMIRQEMIFSRRVLDTLETVGSHPELVNHIPNNLVTLERTTKEVMESLDLITAEYSSPTVWQDISFGLDRLQRAWMKIKEAADDLPLYVPMEITSHRLYKNLSIESANGECACISNNGICGSILTRIIQEAYVKFEPSFHNVLELVALAFRGENKTLQSASLTGISVAARVVRFLGLVMDVERQLKTTQDNSFEFLAKDSFQIQRRTSVENVLEEMCRHIEALQSAFFQPKYLYAKGDASIDGLRELADMMRRCWKESGLLVRHLRKIDPEFAKLATTKYVRLLNHAASLATTMQDSADVQDFSTESIPIQYDDGVVEDILAGQIWLLPCLSDLFALSQWCVKKMESTSCVGTEETNDHFRLGDFKKVIYDLIMVSIARASWLLTWTERSAAPNLHSLRDLGAQTLLLVYNYNKSGLSLRCTASSPIEDMRLHSALVHSTTSLINGILQVHELIQEALHQQVYGQGSDLYPATEVGEEESLLFHEVLDSTPFLSSQFSLHSFPVDFGRLWEGDGNNGLVSNISGSRELSEEWNIQNEAELASNGVTRSHRSVSEVSVDLSTGFNDFVHENGSEIQGSLEAEHLLTINETREAAGPSVTGPFMEPIPTTISPPLHKQTNWNLKSKLLSCMCCESVQSVCLELTNRSSKFCAICKTSKLNNAVDVTIAEEEEEEVEESIIGLQSVLAEDLKAQELIGRGSAGMVWKMTYFEKPVAVKIMNQSFLNGTKKQFLQATRLHNRLSGHPNIVEFVGTCPEFQQKDDSPGLNLVMIMELCDLGDLFKIICEARWVRDRKKCKQDISEHMSSRGYMIYSNWALRVKIACDIAAGMAHMHSQGIVHRDLTSYNVVLKRGDEGEWIAKVCDFERSREIPESGFIPRSDTFANSPAWAAPEIIENRDYSTQADVYSMGIILWELVTLQDPIEIYTDCIRSSKLFCHNNKRDRMLSKLSDCCDPEFPELSYKLSCLIHQCLEDDMHSRPTMQSLHQSLIELHNTITQLFY